MTLPPLCLLFDLDGTILDSLPGIEYSVGAAFRARGCELFHADLRSVIGPPIRNILARAGEVKNTETLDGLEREFRKSYDSEGWQKTVCYPNAKDALGALRTRGHRLFVVSNKPQHISLRILEREGLLGLFEAILTADTRTPKFSGKAEMLHALLARYGISPAECILVGDTMEDADAAAGECIRFVFMTHGYGELIESPIQPIACKADSFSQLLAWVIQEQVCD